MLLSRARRVRQYCAPPRRESLRSLNRRTSTESIRSARTVSRLLLMDVPGLTLQVCFPEGLVHLKPITGLPEPCTRFSSPPNSGPSPFLEGCWKRWRGRWERRANISAGYPKNCGRDFTPETSVTQRENSLFWGDAANSHQPAEQAAELPWPGPADVTRKPCRCAGRGSASSFSRAIGASRTSQNQPSVWLAWHECY